MRTDEDKLRERYRKFARYEAHGVSPLYEEFACAVSENEDALHFLLPLPAAKQQPNLLFGAVRKTCGVAQDGDEFCRLLLGNQDEIRATMLVKSTQTNEPARCATLLLILSRLPQPIALLEVGASAGLCLYPDRYKYVYGDYQLDPPGAEEAPAFVCAASENTPLPKALPEIVWRTGIDLNPLDVEAAEDMAWLENLIWPEHTTRLENLRRAIAIARGEPPDLVQGDLLTALASVASKAPSEATLVVFHSAVLAYVQDNEARNRFVATVAGLDATWVSNEHPLVFPQIAAKLSANPLKNQFLLAVDGHPVASTGPHGQSINWFRE